MTDEKNINLILHTNHSQEAITNTGKTLKDDAVVKLRS
jgi:hypothetical protein